MAETDAQSITFAYVFFFIIKLHIGMNFFKIFQDFYGSIFAAIVNDNNFLIQIFYGFDKPDNVRNCILLVIDGNDNG